MLGLGDGQTRPNHPIGTPPHTLPTDAEAEQLVRQMIALGIRAFDTAASLWMLGAATGFRIRPTHRHQHQSR